MRFVESPSTPSPAAWAASEASELAALRAGDEGAFLALVQRLHGAMLRVAAWHVRSRASAEEVVQEAWVSVLAGLHRFEGRSSLRTWIFGILVHCAETRRVRDGRSVPLSSLCDGDSEDGPAVAAERFLDDHELWSGNWARPPSPWPDARLESGEVVALVREALDGLPEPQQTVMALRDVADWDAEEVCALLGITMGNQRVLLHRARSRVRGFLEARLGQEAPG